MNKWQEMYNRKRMTAEGCAKRIANHDGILFNLGNGAPRAVSDAIAKRIREDGLTGLHVITGLEVKWTDLMSPDLADHVTVDSGFVSVVSRHGVHNGYLTYSTNRLAQSIDIVDRCKPGITRGAVSCVVSAMDEHGWFSTGTHADLAWGGIRSGQFREVILEVNNHMPRAFGNNHIHISEVTALCENNEPLIAIPEISLTPEDEAIGQYVAELIPDGACLQIGIGGMPNAVAKYLKDKRDLGVHSEMLTDSMVELMECGALNNSKKQIDRMKMVGCFALGSQKLYDFVHNNPGVEMHCSSYVNDPFVIQRNDNVAAINSTIEVDITGQACSEALGPLQYSGTGGQLDFVQGAWRSRGGKSFLTLYATYTDKEGTMHSRIKPYLSPGSIITTPRTDVEYVVTEFGVAYLKGQDVRTRVMGLINIAHPDFRDELTFEAKKLNLLR